MTETDTTNGHHPKTDPAPPPTERRVLYLATVDRGVVKYEREASLDDIRAVLGELGLTVEPAQAIGGLQIPGLLTDSADGRLRIGAARLDLDVSGFDGDAGDRLSLAKLMPVMPVGGKLISERTHEIAFARAEALGLTNYELQVSDILGALDERFGRSA